MSLSISIVVIIQYFMAVILDMRKYDQPSTLPSF